MKLIRQTKLHFRSEKSDKVYEVDLCEAGDGEFIVNFRYGRRGTNLKEGTKTPFPESQSKADDIFDKLVKSKTDKGYQITDETAGMPAAAVASASPTAVATPASDDPRVEATLRLLRRAASGEPTGSTWKVSRAIWRAGSWMLVDAAPMIAAIAGGASDEFVRWSAAWALGRIGSEEQVAVLDELATKGPPDSSARRMARLAKLAIVNDEERTRIADNELAKLPPSVRDAIVAEDVAGLSAAIRDHLTGDAGRWMGSTLYGVAMSRPWIREAIHEVVVAVAPDEESMRFLRQTFKAAEMTMDAELFGALVKKFETSPGRGTAQWVYQNREWKKGRAPAFGTATKEYFQRRFVRHLQVAGESGRPELYVPLATGVLLANDDAIQQPEEAFEVDWHWDWDNREYTERRRYGPRYARHHCFLWVLRSAGATLLPPTRSMRWWYAADKRGFATTREEPFQELWDQAPDAVAHLLRHARSEEAQRFAGRVWRANPAFANEADIPLVRDLLGSWFEGTVELGLELARRMWDPATPNVELLLAMLDAALEAARVLGAQWLDAVESKVRHDGNFLAGLAFLKHSDAQERARALAKTAALPADGQKRLVALIVSALVSMTDPDDEAICAHATDFVLLIARDALAELGTEHIGALLTHPLEAGQQLGAHALLRHADVGSLPDAMLLGPLSSPFVSVRRLGMQVMQQLSDEQLQARSELIAGFGTSEHTEIRQEALALIERLVRGNAELGRELVEQWYPLILREESYEGLHADVFALLTGALSDHLVAIPASSFRRMLALRYGYAQMLAFELLKRHTRFADEPLDTVVGWGCHDLLALREGVRAHFNTTPTRLAESPGAITPMLETDWVDAQEWAFDFCRDKVPEDAWDPLGLVAVCDSVKPRVQAFGREMVTKRFREEDGPLYLQRLSEHPTADLQVFATNYLARFATDDLEAMKSLEHYFRAVLTRIGAGRVAKDRVLSFLQAEAKKDEAAARFVEALLRRQVATVAIADKATCIRILADIRRDWPEIPTALIRKAPAVHKPEAR